MTKDELKKEAEESFEKYRVTDIDYVVSPYSDDEGEKMLMFNREYDAEEEYFRLYSKGYLASAEPREKRIAELETRCNELFLQTMQLSKAKEIIKTFLAIVNNDVEYVQNPQDCKDLWKELCEKAEQFIKDSEVEK